MTPDCVVQCDPSLGIVSEVKLGLPRETEYWDDDVQQVEKYDDDLTGWWTPSEKVGNHDIIALVPSPRSVQFCDVVQGGIANKKWRFDRSIAVVGFHKQTGAEKTFLTLKKECGKVSDVALNERLRLGVPIDIVHLIRDDRKFLDHKPPLPLLLQILWSDLFTKYAAEVEREEPSGTATISVSVSAVTADLQKYYGYASTGARSPEIPRANWVSEALDALVEFGLATKSAPGEYSVGYRKIRRDIVEFFGRRCFRRERQILRAAAKKKEQPPIPFPQDPTGTNMPPA